jgi:hypothetical protein
MVSNTRIPSIAGVDVESDDPDLRGQKAEAIGVLVRWTVTQEEIDREIALHGQFANRGPGVYYRLKAPEGVATAQVRPLRGAP